MHMDVTLEIFSRVTRSLGNSLCIFEDQTCAAFETQELEREQAARQQRQEKSATNVASESRKLTPLGSNARSKAQKLKGFNLSTYKYHALGDYVDTIQRFGTT